MQAQTGDELRFLTQVLGQPARQATIVEVRGDTGEPPYLVRFDDGAERLVYPGSNCLLVEQRG
ncbi:MAG TPA: DUF1918 domain-containing protein [Pseudonocardia sp.]|jgi:hypothetical protein